MIENILTTENILTAAFLLVIGFCLYQVLQSFRHAEQAKRLAMERARLQPIIEETNFECLERHNMQRQAEWLTQMIARISHPIEYLRTETEIYKFIDGYQDCQGIIGITRDLAIALEGKRRELIGETMVNENGVLDWKEEEA